ncbi:MAG: hypothetical protein IIV78_05955, partial [Oscillospiraceae bacterium]|nr:hypothetical protein [Oscillospiraceae bacterium]
AESLSIFNETGCFEITQNGYEFTVQPMAESLIDWSVGEHEFSVMVRYEDESGNYAYADVAIKLNITEAFVDLKVEPESLTFNCEAGYTSVESQTFRVVDYGNTEFVVSPDTITLRNESMEIDAVFTGDTVTVTPVAGLAKGTYEATLLLMVNDYDIIIPVPVTVVVAPRSYYELTSGGGWEFGEGMEQGTTPPDPMPLVVESVGTLLSESVILTASGDTEYFSITLDGEEVDFTDGPVTIPLLKGMAILKWQVINTNDIGSFEAVYTFTCSEDATVSTSRTLSFDVIAPSGVDFNGEHFDTLAEALAAAEAAGGGVVTLKADTTESMLALNGDVTLDLGGHSLTVDAIVNFGGQVVDSSADKSGKIVCPQGMLMLSEDNDDLLVWDGTESYFFTDIDQVLTQVDSGNGTYKVTFLPKFTQLARIKALLADNGGEDNEVSIKVKLMWDGGQKTLTYHDSMVQNVYSGNAFTVTLTNYEAFIEQNLHLQIIVEAGGVVAASDIITVS